MSGAAKHRLPSEHYLAAEEYLGRAVEAAHRYEPVDVVANALRMAQVHATLATAAEVPSE